MDQKLFKIENFKGQRSTCKFLWNYKSLKKPNSNNISKKGYFYEKLKDHNLKKIILFTQNKKLTKLVKLKSNVEGIFVKFPKKFLYSFFKRKYKKK